MREAIEVDAPTAAESEETTAMQEQEEARVEARKGTDFAHSGMESAESE